MPGFPVIEIMYHAAGSVDSDTAAYVKPDGIKKIITALIRFWMGAFYIDAERQYSSSVNFE